MVKIMNYSFILMVLSAISSAVPTPPAPTPSGGYVSGDGTGALVSSEQLLAAAPGTSSCIAGPNAECATAAKAAPLLSAAFQKYGHTSYGQMAALLGLMTLESGDFAFNTNKFPGRPGQGTRAMLMFNFIYDYAYSQPSLQATVLRLSGGQKLSLPDMASIDSVPVATQQAIRALVLTDDYTYGAASWYLANKCAPSFATQLSTGTFQAFQSYITSCVDAGEVTEDRKAKWCAACKALKPVGGSVPPECL